MSKFKRRQNKLKRTRRISELEKNGGGFHTNSVSPDLAANGFRESVIRDCSVLAQMMNDYPHSDRIKTYKTTTGMVMIDLPKADAELLLSGLLINQNYSVDETANVVAKIHNARSVVFRFKD